MSNDVKKSSAEWQDETEVLVVDPDGWDRVHFEQSWNEPITKEEFQLRLMNSTVAPRSFWRA